MNNTGYVLLYFVYGLAFFVMGVAALLQSSTNSSFPLQKAIHYLGFFGLVHGITEWIIMTLLSRLVPDLRNLLVVLGTFTNGLSFAFLWLFGMSLMATESPFWNRVKNLPWLIFGFWLIPYLVYLIDNGIGNISWYLLEDIFSRYLIGFPGAVTVFYALRKQSDSLKEVELTRISLKMKALAVFFLMYGVFTGIVVDNKGFFPNNLVNKDMFRAATGFPVELGRATMAIAITILVVNIIRIFEWENLRKINRLTRQQVRTQRSIELGRELHDGIVQHMFVTGLKLEEVIAKEDEPQTLASLRDIKTDINRIMNQLRTFIDAKPQAMIQVEDLQSSLNNLAQGFEKNWNLAVTFHNHIPEYTYGALSKETTTNLYYIVQEALWNAFKHAEASKVGIDLTGSMTSLTATVQDNGKGFDVTQVPQDAHFGLQHMRERAAEMKGVLSIQSSQKGTRITITVPWEESTDE